MRCRDGERIVAALGLRTVLPANWQSGLAEVAERGVFVTPSIAGWVFAAGPDLRGPVGGEADFVQPLLERLSATFGEAAWFTTHEQQEHHGWALASRGELLRGYAFTAAAGPVFWHGEVTETEHALGCFVDDPRDQSDDDVKWWPDERIVLEIATAWSLDPRQLERLAAGPSAGWVGRL